jgi:hypothetical protein
MLGDSNTIKNDLGASLKFLDELPGSDALKAAKLNAMKELALKAERVDGELQRLKPKLESVCKYFGEEAKDTPPEEVFKHLNQFIQNLDRAWKQIAQKEEQEKALRLRNEQKALKEKQRKQKTRESELSPTSPEEENQVVDDLLAVLRTGRAFKDRRQNAVDRSPSLNGRRLLCLSDLFSVDDFRQEFQEEARTAQACG